MADKKQVIEGRRLESHEMGNEDVFHPFPMSAVAAPLGSLDTFMGAKEPLLILSYMHKIKIWGEAAKNTTGDPAPLSGHFDTVNADIAPDEIFAWAGADMVTAGGEFPPDMAGAFNDLVFIEITRGRFNVWDQPGSLAFPSVTLNDFWSDIQVGGVFGARILYDQFTNRFVHIAIDRQNDVFGPTNKILFAISEVDDPTTWFRTSLLAGVAPFASATTNYVQLGVDDLGYYITADLDTLGLSSVWVIDKGPLATLPPTTIPAGPGSGLGTVTVFHFGPTNGVVGMIPVHTWLQNESSFGKEYFIGTPTPGSADWPAFRMFEVSGPRNAPIFASTGLLPTAPYFPAPLAPAFGSTPSIRDGVGDFRLRNAVYRLDNRLQPTGSIWTCLSSISGGRAAPLWFELNPVTPFSPSSVRQSGFVDDPTFHYFNPSIMVNKDGGAMMGFSGSWGSATVAAYYTGRLPTDPPGTMGPVLLAKGGEAAYINLDPSTFNIWGRYSAPVLSPTDETLFFTVQEYAKTPPNTWGSWIAGLEFVERTLSVVIDPVGALSAGATVDRLPLPPYFQGDDVILTANSVAGDWTFNHWEDGLTGTTNPDTVTMDISKTVTAVYAQTEYFIDTTVLPTEAVSAGATITLDTGPYRLNDNIGVTANNSGGWMFDHWEGDLSGSTNPENLTITITEPPVFDITAVFIGPALDITIEPAQAETDGATVDTVPTPPFALDAVVEVTATAPQLWRFDHWEGDLQGNGNPIDITMSGPKTVTAVFEGKFHPADVRDILFAGDEGSPNPDFKIEIDESITYFSAWLASIPWAVGGPSPPSIDFAITSFVLFLQNDGRYYHVDSASEPIDSWPTGGMVVTPPDDICESGAPGGPFTGEQIYTITNLTTSSINFVVGKSVAWVSLDGGDSEVAGVLASLASVQVTVSIDTDANALPIGNHADVIRFLNLTNGKGDTTRLVKLDVVAVTTAPPTTTGPPLPTTAPPVPIPTFPPPLKWLQDPEFADPGMAIKVDQFAGSYIIADDFICRANDRIVTITIWGAFKGDVVGTPSFELSFWHDIPAESAPFGHSVPGAMAWTKTFSPSEYSVVLETTLTDWWWDPDAPVGPSNPSLSTGTTQDFKYTFDIDLDQAFLQTGESETPVTYWLSVRAIGASYEFGWKTRLFGENFNDNAVFAETTVPVPASWAEFTYPTGHPGAGAPLDMAFMLESSTDQPTTLPPTTTPPTTAPPPPFGKDYVQLPDIANPTTPTGMDIKCSDLTLVGDSEPVIVADEWLCPGSGPITNITIWMSRLDDAEPTVIVSIELSIHSNVLDGGSGFPVPGPVAWTKTFSAAEFTRSPFAVVSNGEWWLGLPSGSPIHPGDTVVELVDFPVPFGEEFVQVFGETYWLSVRIHVASGSPTTQAGWKTRDPGDGFSGEFAVWALSAGAPTPGGWTPLLYPVTHPLATAPIDMSFVVFTPDVPPTTIPPP